MATKTHKVSGWTRTAIGHGNFTISPTDGTGDRVVAFMSAHSWANLPNDRREDPGRDRVVLISGDPLPDWAMVWLNTVNARMYERGREALRAAIADADWAQDMRDSNDY
jgi:hypothetical protein